MPSLDPSSSSFDFLVDRDFRGRGVFPLTMTPPPPEQFASRLILGPALRTQPDRRLVKLVREGYESAFEEIDRRYRKQLERFAASFVGSRSEDVMQEAF